MNIFVLSTDPREAARMLCDKHVVGMIRETSQMLATCLKAHGIDGPMTEDYATGMTRPMKPTHFNHPCNVWLRQSASNYLWLLEHFEEMLAEYRRRWPQSGPHKYEREAHVEHYRVMAGCMEWAEPTPFAQVMPDLYKDPDPVAAYRQFYKGEKARFASWKGGNFPWWWGSQTKSDAVG